MSLENKCSIVEAAAGCKAGQFIHIHGYTNEHGEVQNVTVHADASYKRTHERSAVMLDAMEKDESLSIEITRNAWVDAAGNEFALKGKKTDNRTRKTGIRETVTIHDPDWAEAVAKVRKGIIDPRKVTDNFEKVAGSTYDNTNTGKTYLRNVLVHEKTVVKQGVYPVSCSARVNVIAEAIKAKLPVGSYRTYVLDDETVTLPDGSKVPRFEYVAMTGEHVSSSSSSED